MNLESLPSKFFHSSRKRIEVPFCSYVNHFYYFCIVPYRCRWCHDDNASTARTFTIFLERNRFQQLICGLFHLIAFSAQVSNLAEVLQWDSISSPMDTIPLALKITEAIFISSWIRSFWNKDLLEQLAGKMVEAELEIRQSEKNKFGKLLTGVYLILPILEFLLDLTVDGVFPWAGATRDLYFAKKETGSLTKAEATDPILSYLSLLSTFSKKLLLFILAANDFFIFLVSRKSFEVAR